MKREWLPHTDQGWLTKPTAPERAANNGWHKRLRRGFTLIEIMVVVVILGILAATIIPQFMGTTHEARVNTAKANIAELESALERFHIHLDRYATADEGL